MEEEPDQEPDAEQIKKDQEIMRKLQEQKKKEREQMFKKTPKEDESKQKAKDLFEKRMQKK
jgi:hypothetical protein